MSTAGERRRLWWEAQHDLLTGLLNRAGLAAAAAEAFGPGQPAGPAAAAAVLLVDLDDFKSINDVHAHVAGDGVLAGVAAKLRGQAALLGGATARLGGDELAVLLPGTGQAVAAAAAASAGRLLVGPHPVRGGTGPVRVRVAASVGVGVAVREELRSLGQLLELADSAMYAAKRSRSGWALRSAGTGRDPAGPGAAPRRSCRGHPRGHSSRVASRGEVRGGELLRRA